MTLVRLEWNFAYKRLFQKNVTQSANFSYAGAATAASVTLSGNITGQTSIAPVADVAAWHLMHSFP